MPLFPWEGEEVPGVSCGEIAPGKEVVLLARSGGVISVVLDHSQPNETPTTTPATVSQPAEHVPSEPALTPATPDGEWKGE